MLKSLRSKFIPSSTPAPSELDGSSTAPTLDDGIVTAEKVTQLDAKAPAAAVDEAVDHAVDRARPNEAAQDGVTQAEAITLSWTKTSLGAAYVLYVQIRCIQEAGNWLSIPSMFLLYFVNAFQSSITSNLSAFVTSGFESHSLIPVIYVVSSVMAAATYMPVARILNLWDRSIGFLVMASFATLGLVLSATCKTIAEYCASQVN
jgi:hypothetical protein